LSKLYRLAGAGAITLATGLFIASAQAAVAAQPKMQTVNPRTTSTWFFESFDGQYGIGAPTLGLDDAVDETVSGRRVLIEGDGGTDQVQATKASVTTTHHIKEAFAIYRVGVPTLVAGDAAIETTGGRRLDIVPDGNNDGGVFLEFAETTSLCVTAGTSGGVLVEPCSDATHDVWFEEQGPSHLLFENGASNKYLSGPDNGGQFQVMSRPAPSGWEQQFIVETP
jgi:hypothetical protein